MLELSNSIYTPPSYLQIFLMDTILIFYLITQRYDDQRILSAQPPKQSHIRSKQNFTGISNLLQSYTFTAFQQSDLQIQGELVIPLQNTLVVFRYKQNLGSHLPKLHLTRSYIKQHNAGLYERCKLKTLNLSSVLVTGVISPWGENTTIDRFLSTYSLNDFKSDIVFNQLTTSCNFKHFLKLLEILGTGIGIKFKISTVIC